MESFKEKYLPLIRTLKLEPFICIYFLGYATKLVTITQLMQDKLCIVDHKYSVDFCKTLNATNDLLLSRKSRILSESSQYQLYQAIISTIPIVFTMLFVGSWIDKNPKAVKFFGALMVIGATFEVSILILNAFYFDWSTGLILLSFIPTALCGSHIYALMAAYSYVPQTTPEHLRPIRFSLIDFSYILGLTVGQYLGGLVLSMKPIGHNLLRNYIGVFVVTIFCNAVSILWLLFAFRERKKALLITYNEEEVESETLEATNSSVNCVQNTGSPNPEVSRNVLVDIFDWEGARETVITCFKRRCNNGRLQLWLLISSMYVFDVIVVGQTAIGFQFVERVYGWNATKYSNITAISYIWNTVAIASFTYILVKKFKAGDLLIAIVGIVSLIAMMTVRGSLLTPEAYYLSIVVGSATLISSVGIRSAISNLVSKDELGKVMSTVTALESTVQVTSNAIFSITLKLVIHRQPGLLYEILAIPLLYPLLVFILIELCIRQTCTQQNVESRIEERAVGCAGNIQNVPNDECNA